MENNAIQAKGAEIRYDKHIVNRMDTFVQLNENLASFDEIWHYLAANYSLSRNSVCLKE